MSPTITSLGTIAGALLGTAAYMSPEQARGGNVDRRADVWSFGCVLWEMLSGRRLFEGETVSDTLAAVLRAPVEAESLPVGVPASLRRLVLRCLERDPRRRLRDIGEARIALESFGSEPEPAGATAPAPPPLWRRALPWAVALLALGGLVATWLVASRPKPAPSVVRFSIDPWEKIASMRWPRISPDGRYVAFLGRGKDEAASRIWIRPMDSFDAHPLAGTEGAKRPFWSPDSRYLAFFTGNRLVKVPVGGGPPQLICDAEGSDGSWGTGGIILFDNTSTSPIRSVPASGGVPSVAVKAVTEGGNAAGMGWPFFLPDGKHFLYEGRPNAAATGGNMIFVAALGEGEGTPLVPTASRVEYANGHLLYVLSDTLVAQPFDVERLRIAGDPVPVAIGVTLSAQNDSADFSVSASGDLVFSDSAATGSSELLWVDRSGKELGKIGSPGKYLHVAISPDGTRLAYTDGGGSQVSLWVRDLRRESVTRITSDPSVTVWPIWSPDGSRLAYASNRSSRFAVYTRASTGTGPETLLYSMPKTNVGPTDWSLDGSRITVSYSQPPSNWDIDLIPAAGKGDVVPVTHEPAAEREGRISPNGKWIAYTSDESGRQEVYVRPLPPTEEKWTISNAGGSEPKWRRDGRELFYLGPNGALFAVPVRTDGSFEVGIPVELFATRVPESAVTFERYDVSADGSRFVINSVVQDARPAPFRVALHMIGEGSGLTD